MYGKIFDSIYDGTLRVNWKALVTFQQLIILADRDGVVDMTPHAIHGRTGIPLDIIEDGITHLASPDPYSRSNLEEGRRVVLLDPSRPWGWRIVNHGYYQQLKTREDKRQADRDRVAAKRADEKIREKSDMSRDVANGRAPSLGVAGVAYADVTTDTDKYKNSDSDKRGTTSSAEPESTRAEAQDASALIVVLLPLVDGVEYPIAESDVKTWSVAYPAVDVRQELYRMRAWLIANPKNRKTKAGIFRFVVNWLSKNQNRAPRSSQSSVADHNTAAAQEFLRRRGHAT